jgi:transketolase
MVKEALEAAELLDKEGIDAQVVNLHTIKPVDEETLYQSARKTGVFVTSEEHTIVGGMGSVVAESIVKNYPIPIEFVGINDVFGVSGKAQELLDYFGLRAVNIVNAVKKVLKRKKSLTLDKEEMIGKAAVSQEI